MSTLRKKDLIRQMVEENDLTKNDINIIVDTVLDTIIGALAKGEKVEIRDFGIFKIRNRKSRIGRNPQTGEKVSISPQKKPYFKFGKNLVSQIRAK